MNNEVEIQCGSSEIPMNVEPKKGETMNIEVENHDGSTVETLTNVEPKKGCWRKLLELVGRYLSPIEKDTWLKQMRGNLSLMATVIATMTFQMALNPPGGLRSVKDDPYPQGVKTRNANRPNPNNADKEFLPCGDFGNDTYWDICPGEAILAAVYPFEYLIFLLSNTICFVASLIVCLLLMSGIRWQHRFPMRILSLGMCLSLSSLATSYAAALNMTTPNSIYPTAVRVLRVLLFTVSGLFWIIFLCHILRLVICGVKLVFGKKRKKRKRKRKKGIPD